MFTFATRLRQLPQTRLLGRPRTLSVSRTNVSLARKRAISTTVPCRALRVDSPVEGDDDLAISASRPEQEHAVISTFDLFSIGGVYSLGF